MRFALSLLLLCASASAAVCFDHGTPREVRESARRAQLHGKRCWIVAINAHDKKWPRYEISLDLVFLHEFGHCLGWDHQPADSVMENPLYDHLTKQDLERIGGSQP